MKRKLLWSSSMTELGAKMYLNMMVHKYGCNPKDRPKFDKKRGMWMYSWYEQVKK